MAYINTIDERYGGTIWSSNADDWDAPSILNESYVLAAFSTAYGTGSDDYITADIDVYSLGVLAAGHYLLDVDDWTWDWVNYDLGSISSFALHDVNGLAIETSFNPYTDITFTVYSPSTYYLAVTGTSYGTSQYSAYYSKTANLNSAATFSNPTYEGDLSVGSTVSVDITYSDLNGNSDNVFTVFWYTSDSPSILSSGASFDYTLTSDEQGKTLQYQVGFIDDDGYVEFSPIYDIGTIDNLAPSITSSTLFNITEDTPFSFTLTATDPQGDNVSFSAPDLPDWLALTDNGSGTATLTGTASEYEVWQYYWKDPDNYWANPQQSIDITVSDGVNSKVVSHDFSIINVLNEPIPTPLYWPPLDNIYDLFMQGSAWLFPEGVSRTIDWALTDVIDSWGASSDFVASKINEIVEATEKFIDIDFNYAGYFTSYPEANKAGVELNFSLDYGHIINSSGSYGIAGFPSLETISASSDDWFFDYFQAGDVYLNTNMFSGLESASADVVTDFQFVALHEMGHALGLKHPHDTGGTQRPTFDDAGMDEYNDVLYTIMAYENTGVFATNSIAVPLTPMILDAITLQYLYGKKTTGDSVGDTLYEPGVDYGAYVLDYDVSGYDTFSAAKLNVAQEIYINQFIIADTCVSFLNDSGDVPPLQQAVGVLGSIENVVCTSNDDLIFDYSNNDLMTTKITSLSLDGGSGEDNLTLIKSFSDIELLSLSNATYTMQFSDITYQLKNVESLTDAVSETKSIEQLYNEYKINEAPVLASALADATATEDSAYSYDTSANFSDPDGDTLTYTATLSNGSALPSWLNISSTGTLSGTPANGDVGAIEVTVTATDSSSTAASDTFTLTVSNTNDTPVVESAIADSGASEDSAYSYDTSSSFSDVDGDSLTYTAMLSSGNALPSWLSISSTGTLSGTPANGDVGSIEVTVTATDSSSASASDTFALTVSNTNDTPVVASALADATATEGSTYSYDASANFSDADGDTLTYTATLSNGNPLPSWIEMSSTGTLSGTPANGDVGALEVTVTATDSSSASANDTFALTVSNTSDTSIDTFFGLELSNSNITGWSNGDYLVAWEFISPSNGTSLYVQKYTAGGPAYGTSHVSKDFGSGAPGLPTAQPTSPSTIILSNSDYLLCWQFDKKIYAQRYTSDGDSVGAEIQVNGDASEVYLAESGMLATAGAGFIVAWAERSNGESYVKFKEYNSSGTPIGGEVNVNTLDSNTYKYPVISTAVDDGFAISYYQTSSDSTVSSGQLTEGYQKLFNQDQTSRTTAQVYDSSLYPHGDYINIVSLVDGNYVIAWTSNEPLTSGLDVRYQLYNKDGSLKGAMRIAHSTEQYDQLDPSITALENGGFVIVWTDVSASGWEANIIAQTFDADGNKQGSEFGINSYRHGSQYEHDVTALGDGRIAVTWKSVPDYEDYSFGPIPGIYINQFDALNGTDVDEGRAIGSVGNDNFIGGDGDDLFYGLEGHDDLHGGAGNDVLYGGAGGDLLAGDSGDDRLYTNAGTDYCLGGTEADSITLTADSTWSSGYVAKNISSGDSIGTHQALELTGLNRFSDVIDGGADVDTLTLTSGSDAFFLDDVYSGHHESLTLSETTRGTDSTARIINLEVINAGAGNDIIDLTSLDFTLADSVTINGEAGNDTLWGANGDDTINGGAGNDTLFGGSGDDTLTGGTGHDTFQFTATSGSDTISDFTVSDQDILEFYYRSGSTSDINDLTLTNGVLNWATGDDDRTVQIDLSGTITSGDINDYSDLISFVEIA